MYHKTAIILYNLGGPDSLEAVKPFLFNLFNDKAILPVPQPLRWLLAKFISYRRHNKSKLIYEKIGGKSSILEQSDDQANALTKLLKRRHINNRSARVFVAMRYWNPRLKTVLKDISDYDPQKIVLLPLYPHFSTTTTGSFISEYQSLVRSKYKNIAHIPMHSVCCYYSNQLFISAHKELLYRSLIQAVSSYPYSKIRILFSAHGLPQRTIKLGDPYQWQIEKNVEIIMNQLAEEGWENLKRNCTYDYRICYQSKVGNLPWLEPNTVDEIKIASNAGMVLVIVPISFVSEHSETLVELDIDYKEVAMSNNAKGYIRVPALQCVPDYIECLYALFKEEIPKTCSQCTHSLKS